MSSETSVPQCLMLESLLIILYVYDLKNESPHLTDPIIFVDDINLHLYIYMHKLFSMVNQELASIS